MYRARQPVGAPVPHQIPRLRQRPYRLLEEERVASLEQHLLQEVQPLVGAEERPEQFSCALDWQGVQPELRVVGLATPPVLILGPVADEEQEAGRPETLH